LIAVRNRNSEISFLDPTRDRMRLNMQQFYSAYSSNIAL